MTEQRSALRAWPQHEDSPVRPLDGGLINSTFVVGDPPAAALQKQHAMFPPEVNGDIEAVTAHLAAAGMLTPRLLPTGSGALCHVEPDGACWRMLSWVPGVTVDTLDGPARAAEAGSLVGRWHRATADLEHDFAFSRPGAHDTEAHMATLRRALVEHRGHRLHGEVEALAEQILGGWDAWTGQLEGRPRIAHGDLKISNLRFDAQGRGLCLLDFDTLSKLPLDIELGDAARSWCNPLGEDVAQAQFDVELFEAGFGAYAAANPLQPEEREALPRGVQRICLELAARFAADALAESYFGWRPEVAPTRGDHNLLRAQGQASLAASVAGLLGRMERALLS